MENSIKPAIDNLKIQNVNLRGSTISIRDGVDAINISNLKTLSQSYQSVVKMHESELTFQEDDRTLWQYVFEYAIGIRLILPGEEEQGTQPDFEPILEIAATFSARYLSNDKLPQECLNAFGNENVGYHVWPFWREYAHSSCSKIGLSSVIDIPLYKVSKNGQK